MPSGATAAAGDGRARERAPVSPATTRVCKNLRGCRVLGPMVRVSKLPLTAVVDIR